MDLFYVWLFFVGLIALVVIVTILIAFFTSKREEEYEGEPQLNRSQWHRVSGKTRVGSSPTFIGSSPTFIGGTLCPYCHKPGKWARYDDRMECQNPRCHFYGHIFSK